MFQASKSSTFDVVIMNGRMMDPASHIDRVTSIGIRNGKIATIDPVNRKLEGDTIIDASGLIVTPGFIDIHCHEDTQSAASPNATKRAMSSSQLILGTPVLTMRSRMRDGVTTMIGGNCGESYYPIAGYFKRLREESCLINYASYCGHNILREQIGGERKTALTASEIGKLGT